MRGLALLGLVAILSGCGDTTEAPRPDGRVSARPPAPEDTTLRVRVLDPGGRIFLHRDGAKVLLRGPDGDVRRGPVFDGVAPGSTLAVVAPGCAVFEASAMPKGLQIARLERGIPIRVRLTGLEALPEGLTEFGVGLERAPPDAWWADEVSVLRAVWAGWMDEDRPTKQDWTRVRPPDNEVPLYVPIPGSYLVSWNAGWPNHGWGQTTKTAVAIDADSAGEVFDVPAPLDLLEDLGARARGEKPR